MPNRSTYRQNNGCLGFYLRLHTPTTIDSRVIGSPTGCWTGFSRKGAATCCTEISAVGFPSAFSEEYVLVVPLI